MKPQKNTFSSYEKIPTHLKKMGLNQYQYTELDKVDWMATEKIHGANFSFIYQDRQLFYGKRKEYLTWEDDFFGFQLVVNKLEHQLIRLFEELSQRINTEKIIIYGELFGGKYPHSEVTKQENIQAIQTGIYYSPTIEFCAFDIAFETNQNKKYLDYQEAIQLFEKYQILFVKPLLIGKLNEVLAFDIRIDSTLPKELGFPSLDKNLIEGIVIKPIKELDNAIFPHRPILKIKNPKFEENQVFHQAQKWKFSSKIYSNTEELYFLVKEIRNYVTSNRLASAISKIGKLDLNNTDRLKEIEDELLRDTLEDFDENNSAILEELSESQKMWIEERIRVDCQNLIQNYIEKMINE